MNATLDNTINSTNSPLIEILQRSFNEPPSSMSMSNQPPAQDSDTSASMSILNSSSLSSASHLPLTSPINNTPHGVSPIIPTPSMVSPFSAFHVDPNVLGIQKLDGKNYTRWRKGLQIILIGYGLWPMVSQDSPIQPSEE